MLLAAYLKYRISDQILFRNSGKRQYHGEITIMELQSLVVFGCTAQLLSLLIR